MRSQKEAQVLSKLGYDVRSIKGGMAAWNQVYDVAKMPLGDGSIKKAPFNVKK